jgi:hypothetical protein
MCTWIKTKLDQKINKEKANIFVSATCFKEMGKTCSTHRKMRNTYKILNGKPQGKILYWSIPVELITIQY